MKILVCTTLLLVVVFNSCVNDVSDAIENNKEDSSKQVEVPHEKDIVPHPKLTKSVCDCDSSTIDGIVDFTLSEIYKIHICTDLIEVDFNSNQIPYSEFKIVDCNHPETNFLKFDAIEWYYIKNEGDHLLLTYLTPLPAIDDCETWNYYPTADCKVFFRNDSLVKTDLAPYFDPIQIDEELETELINSIIPSSGFDQNWECLISRLELIALNGNEEAAEKLLNLEDILDQKADGAIAECLANAQANVIWHSNY